MPQRGDAEAALRAPRVLYPKSSSPVPVRLALLIALISSALAFLPIVGSRLARLLPDHAWSHGARLSPPGAGRARGAVGLPAVSANLGVSRALPAQTKPKRFSRSPVVRARVFGEAIAVVGLGVVLGVTIGILAALYGS